MDQTKNTRQLSKKDMENGLLGAILSDLRVEKDISQKEAAIKIKKTQPFISKIEASKDLRFSTAVSFLDAIGYKVVFVEK
jgi:transcriptional regulator with XRE-family HTH domain